MYHPMNILTVHSVRYVGLVAQSVEQRTENPCVGGSIPPQTTTYYCFFVFIFVVFYHFLGYNVAYVKCSV